MCKQISILSRCCSRSVCFQNMSIRFRNIVSIRHVFFLCLDRVIGWMELAAFFVYLERNEFRRKYFLPKHVAIIFSNYDSRVLSGRRFFTIVWFFPNHCDLILKKKKEKNAKDVDNWKVFQHRRHVNRKEKDNIAKQATTCNIWKLLFLKDAMHRFSIFMETPFKEFSGKRISNKIINRVINCVKFRF